MGSFFDSMEDEEMGMAIMLMVVVCAGVMYYLLQYALGLSALISGICIFASCVGGFIYWVKYENAKIGNEQALAAAKKMYEPDTTVDAASKKTK